MLSTLERRTRLLLAMLASRQPAVSFLLAFVCSLFLQTSIAQATSSSTPRVPGVAVLELQGTDLAPESLRIWTDILRATVVQTLGRRAEVMTAGNQDVLLKQNDIDPAQVCDGTVCDVELLQNLGVDFGFSGSLTRMRQGGFVGTLTVYDTERGTALGSEVLQASDEPALIEQIRRNGALLCRRIPLPGIGGASIDHIAEGRLGGGGNGFDAGQSKVFVDFQSTPRGATVLAGDDPVCNATPCKKKLAPGVYEMRFVLEDHRTFSKVVDVRPGMEPVSATLKATYALLQVNFSAMPTQVTLNGRRVDTHELVSGKRLSPGAYELWVEDDCYVRVGERMVLEEGERKSTLLELVPRVAAVEFLSTDAAGNDVEVKVYADGRLLGQNTAAVPVPVCTQKLELDAWGKRAEVKLPTLQPGQSLTMRVGIGGTVGNIVTTTAMVKFPAQVGLAWRVHGEKEWTKASSQGSLEVRPGRTTVELALPGLEIETRTVDLGPGQTARLKEANENGPLRTDWAEYMSQRQRRTLAWWSVLVPVTGAVITAGAGLWWTAQKAEADSRYENYKAATNRAEGLSHQTAVEQLAETANGLMFATIAGATLTAATVMLPVWLFGQVGESLDGHAYPVE